MLFQRIKPIFKLSYIMKLSDNLEDGSAIHGKCNNIVGGTEAYLHANIPLHMIGTVKHIIEKYHEFKTMRFANNNDSTIYGTNNGIERLFRNNVRRRNGNTAIWNILSNKNV